MQINTIDTMIKLRNILFENPDSINMHDLDLGYMDKDAYPFGYYLDKLYIGKKGDTHSYETAPDKYINRTSMYSVGRLWVNAKILSFWNVNKPLKKIISDINKAKLEFRIDNTWKVDTLNFTLYKLQDKVDNDWKCSMLIPIQTVMKEVDLNGDADKYTLNWSNYRNYYAILHPND